MALRRVKLHEKVSESGGGPGAAEGMPGLRGEAESYGKSYLSGMPGGYAFDEVLGKRA